MKFLPSLRSGCAVTEQRRLTASSLRGFFAVATAVVVFAWTSSTEAALVRRERVIGGLNAPMFTTFAPGDPTRLFIAERGTPSDSGSASASIRVFNLTTNTLEPTPYLTITGLNNTGEGGLLGIAFHPDFQNNPKLYAYVTANDSISGTPFSSYIREYSATSPTAATASTSFKPVMNWSQPQNNHNGGWIGFSPNDNYLYIMSGDGGNGNDQGTGHTEPDGNAQDITNNFLGKALRIDVDRDDFTTDANRNYGIPYDTSESPGNPFAPDTPGATDPVGDNEIWAYGLRNPFRSGFDRATGDLWMGDVGQGAREEVNFQPGNSVGGENYGWRMREGLIATPGVGGAKPTGAIDPVYDYQRPGASGVDPNFTGTTIFGGVPYRGPDPTLQGFYFFGDTSVNRLWMLKPATQTTPQEVVFLSNSMLPANTGSPSGPVAISEDFVGNLYITYLYSGEVYRIVTNGLTPGDFNADAKVDDADLTAWKAGFGTATGATAANGDADRDGDVDGADFLAWQRNFGWSALNVGGGVPAASVPEPTAAALAGLAAIGLVRGRRRG